MIKDLIKDIKKYNPDADVALIKKAWDFSKKAHKGQRRLSGDPFFSHPVEVAKILVHLKMDITTIVAGLLHDTVEDTDVTHEDLVKEFGSDIATLVDGVTKITDLRLVGSEEEIFVESLRKMILVMAKDLRVVFIKLADRVHNLRTLSFLSPQRRVVNAKETMEIYAPLAERLGVGEIKGILEDLAFPHIHPEEYKRVLKESKPFYTKTKKHIKKMQRTILSAMSSEKIKANIKGREKHFYSLWRKLERDYINWDLDKINDIVALRILVDNEKDCYAALGIVHSIYKPVPKIGISDFIAQPKPNGYKSIHTKVFGPEGRIVEVQIRTYKMNEEAEHGLAAHWTYSQAKSKKSSQKILDDGVENKLTWVKNLVNWQNELAGSDEFLEAVKFDVFMHRNFVFSPNGDVYDLPRNATAVDYAYAVHTKLGNYIKAAKVNGRMVPLHHKLVSGDVVEILKNKNSKPPSRGWIEFVVTTDAKRAINKELKK